MNQSKKYITLLTACAMVVMLCACAAKHSHSTDTLWQVDSENHWKVCTDCGEVIDQQPHSLDDQSICAQCGCHVTDHGDFTSVYQYDIHANPIKIAEYAKTGTLFTQALYEYDYDDQGNMIRSREVIDDIFTEEREYIILDGKGLLSKFTGYTEDGAMYTYEYDSHGNEIRHITYDLEGNIESQTDYLYTQLDNGTWYRSQCICTELDGSTTVGEYDTQGNCISTTFYDADGNVIGAKSDR